MPQCCPTTEGTTMSDWTPGLYVADDPAALLSDLLIDPQGAPVTVEVHYEVTPITYRLAADPLTQHTVDGSWSMNLRVIVDADHAPAIGIGTMECAWTCTGVEPLTTDGRYVTEWRALDEPDRHAILSGCTSVVATPT